MSRFELSRFELPRFKSLLLRAGLVGSLLGFAATGAALAEAQSNGVPAQLQGQEQRVALVIGNSNYQTAPKLANPSNDAESMAQLLNSAGFEVTEATDLTRSDMIKVVQDFSAKVAERGPKAVAMVYYAGHGVQLAGENYLIPVDARISTPADLPDNSLRLVDLMGTLEAIPSQTRIVVLDACRNNPFPGVNDAGRGLAIVDAPNGSIVGYSTAPGMEAQDGKGNHSPYTSAFLRRAREPNLPIEQLFKRVRLDVNSATDGRQTPWESSSLTNEFYFFGDTAVASAHAPDSSPVIRTASNLPSRSVREAYDYVLSEGSPKHYEEFIELFPNDPLCDHIRVLLRNWRQASAWHKAVLANSPAAYKSFHDAYSDSPYAQSALELQIRPKVVPLMQFTRVSRLHVFRRDNFGAHAHLHSNIATLPGKGAITHTSMKGGILGNGHHGHAGGLSGKFKTNPMRVGPRHKITPHRFGGDRFGGKKFGGSNFGGSKFGGSRFGGSRFGGSRFGGGHSRSSFAFTGSHRSFGGHGGFRR